MIILHRHLGAVEVHVDEIDMPRLEGVSWRLFKRRSVYYVRGSVAGRPTLLHRHITDAPDGMTVDHIDGNPLNNRRENLRVCSNEENVKSAWGRGAYDQHVASATHLNRVRKRLADGTIRYYEYDRRGHVRRAKT